MSDELKTAASDSEEQQDKTASIDIKIEVQAETAEENQEEDRPGVCCGSCS